MTDRTSFYRTIPPPDALRPFIRSFWVYDGYHPAHLLDRVLPTGTLEIVVPIGGKRLAWRELSGRDGTCRTALVSGPRRIAFDVPTAPQGRLVGVHFHPGGAWPLLAIPMDALADRHHPLEDLLGASARELAERIDDAASDAERLAMLSAFFLQRARASRASHPAVTAMIRRAERGSSDVAIATEVAASGLSHRRFIELFRREVGLTPRDFLRVQRFQRALGIAARSGRAGADLAYEAGYADQSHWLLECRKHAGLSPRELLEKQRGASAVPPAERGQMLPIR
ncbi:helix-turn-helix domain-containing protein [Polyangium jinanense]|uniref:Helix-turn-helix transcriptional regulator n=1 Tax=Polyangium jinanense TaxID=2829994 RepID=A0A9X3XBG5_9BACT|nr:helix-turn-helix domain-containing protein [Polyangium jinanense]MDC3959814.1 helix-turn-helix transcriptional regulator [Polyangium jinanense]MDC3986265.1 helix-turn-helix transcriptional regulator [Polyangium jinanense]